MHSTQKKSLRANVCQGGVCKDASDGMCRGHVRIANGLASAGTARIACEFADAGRHVSELHAGGNAMGRTGMGTVFFFVCFGVGIADSCARRVWRNVSAGFPHWERRSESVACNLDCMGCAHESPSALHRFSMPSGTVGESASLDGGCNDLAEKKNMRFRPDGHGTMKAGFTIEMRCLACCMRRTVRRGAVFALCLHEKLGGGLRSSDVKKKAGSRSLLHGEGCSRRGRGRGRAIGPMQWSDGKCMHTTGLGGGAICACMSLDAAVWSCGRFRRATPATVSKRPWDGSGHH